MSKRKIYFRADGDANIGLGHVIRSLSLAHMLKDHFDCGFIIREPDQYLIENIQSTCSCITQLEYSTNYVQEAEYLVENLECKSSIIVLDGYNFTTAYQLVFRDSGFCVVCIDDINPCHFVADLVINHAGGWTKAEYSTENYTKVLLGLNYALLRPEFLEVNSQNELRHDECLMICMGGADPYNHTLKVLKECILSRKLTEIVVVTGSRYESGQALWSFVRNLDSEMDISIVKSLSAEEMRQTMYRCSMAITSASTVSIEYLSVGGTLFLIQTADNQERIFSYLIENELAMSFETEFKSFQQQKVKRLRYNQSKIDFSGIKTKYINEFNALGVS